MSAHSKESIQVALGQANGLIQQGKLQEAYQLLTQILSLSPDNTDAIFLLSLIALQTRDFEAAIRFLKQVLKATPSNVNALSNIAYAYTETKQHSKAINTYEKLLKRKAHSAQVYYQLAENHRLAGDKSKAKYTLKKGIENYPDAEALYSFLAVEYFYDNDFDEAKQVYLSAYERGLKNENLIKNLAKTHGILGEKDEAIAIYQEAIELYPNNLDLQYMLSAWDKSLFTTDYQKDLLAKLGNNSIPSDQLHNCHYLLALCAKKEGEFLEEMKHLEQGHQAYQRHGIFKHSSEFYLQQLGQIALNRKDSDLEKLRQPKSLSGASPIFIVGTPRSGSTLIESVINAGKETLIQTEESGIFLHSSNFEHSKENADFWPNFTAKIQKALLNYGVSSPTDRFTDKSLDNFFLIDIIVKLFPEAKIIWSKRTPLASLVSILQNNMTYLPWAHSIQEIIEYLAETERLMRHWIERYPANIYVQQYETFTQNPEQQSQQLFEFCGLEWTPDCLDFYKKSFASRTASKAQIRNKVSTTASASYKKYESYFSEYIERYPWLIEL